VQEWGVLPRFLSPEEPSHGRQLLRRLPSGESQPAFKRVLWTVFVVNAAMFAIEIGGFDH
jgi:hypothetical protein